MELVQQRFGEYKEEVAEKKKNQMFDYLRLLFTIKDKITYSKLVGKPEIGLHFLVSYLSYEDKKAANTLNKYIPGNGRPCIRESLCWKLFYYLRPKMNGFKWNQSYVSKTVNKEVKEFKQKVCKYYGWSDREWRINKMFVMKEKEKYCDLLGIENDVRKKLGVERVRIPKIKIQRSKQPKVEGLSRWM